MDRVARQVILLGVAGVAMLALVACGGDEDEMPTGDVTGTADGSPNGEAAALSVSAADYSFDAPDTIADGLTALQFTNEGQENHDLHLMSFNEGASIHEFTGTLHQGGGLDAALEMVSEEGHIAPIGPGETAETTADLEAGDYLLICLESSPDDGEAHALKGMFAPLTVTAP